MTTENWYSIKAADSQAEVFIYGAIGEFGISARDFVQDLEGLTAQNITVRINSPGGSVADGVAIYNALRRHPARVVTAVDGVALSIASLIACAGDTVQASETATLMFHAPWLKYASGNAEDLRRAANALDATGEAMVSAYTHKTGKSKSEILDAMAAETWLTAAEALNFGIVDEVTDALDIAASFDLSRFRNTPEHLTRGIVMPDKKEAQKKPEPVADPVNIAMAAEKKRRDEIRAAFQGFIGRPEIRELYDEVADDMQITVDQARARLLAKLGEGAEPLAGDPRMELYGAASSVVFGDYRQHDSLSEFKAAAVDTLLARAGIKVDNPSPAAKDLHRMSVASMAETCLKARGFNTRDMVKPDLVHQAAHSTSDFPYLLANTANKALMMGFENEPSSHQAWVNTVEVADFKEQSRVQRSEAPALLEIAELGEYTYGSFSGRQEVYSVSTYGRIFKISRQALVNDDLGAFTTLPQAFGASARRLEADKVYSILTTNAAMADSTALFHADHGNLVASSDTSLAVDNLSEARTKLRLQTGAGGVGLLNLVPRFLIVPAALESDAETLLSSLARPDQENPAAMTPAVIRNLELVVEPRLDSNSVKTYYVAASAGQVDHVELAYLDGQQRGIYSEERTDWNTDAMELKARLDFGTKAIDWRGLVKVVLS